MPQYFTLVGFGDVATRVAKQLLKAGVIGESVIAVGREPDSMMETAKLAIQSVKLDVDQLSEVPTSFDDSKMAYFIPPQKAGDYDLRSAAFTNAMTNSSVRPRHIVLISTTGVYGDTSGGWVTEDSVTNPSTARAKRRLSAEHIWQDWCDAHNIGLTILRVPGIYAHSRIPLERLKQREPVVVKDQCGASNRIHAEDLAHAIIRGLETEKSGIFNATDGSPSTITEYLQAAAEVVNLPALPEISLAEAEGVLSERMLSYLKESRKISNKKMLENLKVTLRFPDFREGLRHS